MFKRLSRSETVCAWLQSQESGGHGASPASLVSFIPELVDCVNALRQKLSIQQAVPVAAAGGICDARQVCLLRFAPMAGCHQPTGEHTVFFRLQGRFLPALVTLWGWEVC